MIYYVTIGSNDVRRSVRFYDPVLGALGHAKQFEGHGFAGYGPDPEQPQIFLGRPFDGQAATVGNGMMVAFEARTPAQVRDFHAAALANGGSDEGAPGLRVHYAPDFYAAYVRDPEGNKLAAVCRSAEEPSL
jgi:catechol 2,3-dioxygenase-like lactoylglutathione lyase family enzyme